MSMMDTFPTQGMGKVPTTFASMLGADKSRVAERECHAGQFFPHDLEKTCDIPKLRVFVSIMGTVLEASWGQCSSYKLLIKKSLFFVN